MSGEKIVRHFPAADPPDVGNRWAQRFRRSLLLLPSLACLWRRGSGENDRSLVLIFIWRCHRRSLRRRVRAADASGRCERPMRIEARHAALPRTDRVQIIVVRSRLGSLRAAGRHLGGCSHRNRAGGAFWGVLRVFARARLLSGRASLQHRATPRAASRCSCFRKCATIKGPLRPVCVCVVKSAALRLLCTGLKPPW